MKHLKMLLKNVIMLNNSKKRIALLLAALLVCLLAFTACDGGKGTPTPEAGKDYAASVKLDMGSSTLKQKVTVKTFVDGDTTHFNVPESVMTDGVFKARYLAVNTPESTGKIEEWGKKASNFTREKLSGASSIVIESDDGNWNADSTGGRFLVWVWYRNNESEEYRNLNIEILQNGLPSLRTPPTTVTVQRRLRLLTVQKSKSSISTPDKRIPTSSMVQLWSLH